MATNTPKSYTVPVIRLGIDILACNCVTLPDWRFTLSDPFWRIYWMKETGWHIWYNGNKLALSPRHLVVIPAHTQCHSESSRTATQFYIHFALNSVVNLYKPGVYFLPVAQKASAIIARLMRPVQNRPQDRLMQTVYVKQLCYDCLSRLPEESMNASFYSSKTISAMELMAANLARPLANHEMAKIIGMNTNAFIRLFHKETGISPQKWYADKRISQAALLLSHSAKKIDEIADETGFFDRSHFSRVFRQVKGTGPAAYRKQLEIR